MKNIYFLYLLILGLSLGSCSRYSQSLSMQKATAIENAPLMAQNTIQPIAANSTVAEVLKTENKMPEFKMKPTAIFKTVKKAVVNAVPFKAKQINTAPEYASISKEIISYSSEKTKAKTAGSVPGKTFFLMALSAMAIVGAAIIMFVGFGEGLGMIAVAGIVLFIIGMILFVSAAAQVANARVN